MASVFISKEIYSTWLKQVLEPEPCRPLSAYMTSSKTFSFGIPYTCYRYCQNRTTQSSSSPSGQGPAFLGEVLYLSLKGYWSSSTKEPSLWLSIYCSLNRSNTAIQPGLINCSNCPQSRIPWSPASSTETLNETKRTFQAMCQSTDTRINLLGLISQGFSSMLI